METDYNDEVFALPVSGHYDCGYSYGGITDKVQQTVTPQLFQPAPPVPERSSVYLTNETRQVSISRPRSPPVVLPNSFVASRSETSTPTSALISPDSTTYSQIDARPAVVPKPWTSSKPSSPTSIPYSSQCNSESDLSTLSTRSRQTSTQSTETTNSSFSSPTTTDNPIKPDPLPSHSHPQWFSPTQSAAFSGPRPIQPLRLGRRRICDANSGDVLYQLSDETKLKLSKQAIYRVYEPDSSSTVGTIAYPQDGQVEVAVILRGKDVVMKKGSSSSHRWSFKPSILTKRGALWYWSKDKLRGDVVLSDSKKNGTVVARIQKDVLSFERAGLEQATINEISFSAIALAEMARRSSTYEDAANLAAAIASVALGEATEDRNSDDTVEAVSKPRRKLTLTFR